MSLSFGFDFCCNILTVPSCAVPEDTHLERTTTELYEAAFVQRKGARSGKILQLGGLYDPPDTDPARVVLRKHGLEGFVVAGLVPEGESEPGWHQGPLHVAIDMSVEGGADLLSTLKSRHWDEVDLVRLEDIAGGCLLLRGLLKAGLKTGMVVMIVNGQFPPPLRFASMAEMGIGTDESQSHPNALYSCSLSFALDVLRPHGFHLVRYSGPYACFLHSSRLLPELGPMDPNEFECFRGVRVWGFHKAFPIEFVRDLFFSLETVDELWRRCWQKTASLLASNGKVAPQFLLYY
eukprot:gnl/MRDRNA2_/MRDRNA2_76902_c0_seq3.p1 gnl/MRDRNA2_/MRDRNA2_76902_c0~~gnl/MRDRNA2_/MRDRNA2_76902_c0_seq3.p1  ORF type:complete len:292 (-),score=34.19 gnl/MRDRNA2_/MRDRNA2_76902_c0_seq3:10-885(-)